MFARSAANSAFATSSRNGAARRGPPAHLCAAGRCGDAHELWSERYEGANTDIFAFQDQIAAQVAGAINPAVRNAEIDFVRNKPPGSLRAYDLVL